MFWWIVAVVVIVSVALAWWSSGRWPGILRRKANKPGTGVSDAQEAGVKIQRAAPGAPYR
jgi:hypothetical protein